MKAAIRTLRANARFLLKKCRKRKKLVIDTRAIMRILNAAKTLSMPSNKEVEVRMGSAINTICAKIAEIRIAKKIGSIKWLLFILIEKGEFSISVIAKHQPKYFFGLNQINFSNLCLNHEVCYLSDEKLSF